jgi:hypothetical protein
MKFFLKKKIAQAGLGSEPGIFCLRLFSLSITLPLSSQTFGGTCLWTPFVELI